MSELKPCPFCGGEAKVINEVSTFTKSNLIAYVRCEECGASAAFYRHDTQTRKESGEKYIERAIEAWNRRANDGN